MPFPAASAPSLTPFTATTETGWAELRGTVREPVLELHFHGRLPHPTLANTTMNEWAKSIGARFDRSTTSWLATGVGSLTPSRTLAEAGLRLAWDTRPAEFAELSSIDQLARPISHLVKNKRTVLVRHRLAGFDLCKELIGHGVIWDRDRRLFRIPTTDVLAHDPAGNLIVRPDVHWTAEAVDEAVRLHQHEPVRPELHDMARELAHAVDLDVLTAEQVERLQGIVGRIPSDGREPFPYQRAGALAVAAGRTCLFDEPGVGKSAGALLAARILGAKRTILVVPPLLTTNWRREIAHAKLCDDDKVITYKSGRKQKPLPDEGALIVPDSLLASQPEMAQRVAEWGADVMIVDEAHRLKTIGSKRGDAVLDLAQTVKHPPIALTGTPIFGTPSELITLLELTRMSAPVFGGRHRFLETYCTQDRFGGWHPRKSALGRLNDQLRAHVWVRRRKLDVLPQLPKKVRQPMVLEVPLKDYKDAHKEAVSKIQAWLTMFENDNGRMPTPEEIGEYAVTESITLVSQLRQAAGLTKIAAAAELIEQHIHATGWELDAAGRRIFNRPLLVWVHHKVVGHAMFDALPASIGETGMIAGSTTDAERDRLVDEFQEGRIPVLVCSIIKAGVGLTLTRSQDAIFVEPDWVPANIIQAEDRMHRPGATSQSVQYTTLIAEGTLDTMIQKVLARKTEVLEKALGQTGDSVVVLEEDQRQGLREVITELVMEAINTRPKSRGRAA